MMMIINVPSEIHISILTFLRATDLSSLQQTCTTFSNRTLIQTIIATFATKIYPPELTCGYDKPEISGEDPTVLKDNPTYEILRNMEMLLVARVLSRPEPGLNERKNGCFYVSKAWCKAALKWLDVHEEQRKERYKLKIAAVEEAAAAATATAVGANHNKKYNKKYNKGKGKKQSKKMKKQERRKNRQASDMLPPWPIVNHDIICEHGFLKQSYSHTNTMPNSNNGGGNTLNDGNNNNNNNNNNHTPGGGSRSARAKRRLMDKQAWKVLKKLYPEGIQLSTLHGECIQCTMETEAKKKNVEMKQTKEREERKKPLQNVHVRQFYSRRRGVPKHCLTMSEGEYENKFALSALGTNTNIATPGKKGSHTASCPLVPGVYYVLPRSWCHKWRKYIKTGEGGKPCAPDTSSCLCDAHRLPLIPPHLESFLYGETCSLLGTSNDINTMDSIGVSELSVSSPVASTSTVASRSNVMTIHDIITPTRSSSTTSTTSSSVQVTSPRPLPVGFYPVDQRLGGTPRSKTHSNLATSRQSSTSTTASSRPQSQPRPEPELDDHIISTLRASGLSEAEIQLQRFAMMQIEEQQQQRAEEEAARQLQLYQQQEQLLRMSRQASQNSMNHHDQDIMNNIMSPEEIRADLNAKLDRENKVVIEILTDDEFIALEKWWPENYSSYALKFAITENNDNDDDHRNISTVIMNGGCVGGTEIVWTTPPCRACDASGYSNHDFVVRNRCRNWVKATPNKKKKK